MATNSLMKEYVRRQLRYWVEDFTDELLPRDFVSKSFSRTQLLLPDIRLKPHRIAALLHLPPPLLVTQARCIELTIAVPSWTETSHKEGPTRPVLVHVNELLVQLRNIWECSSKVRRAAEARVQAALLEPDPLGSSAAMLEFARDVVERTKLMVDKLCVQIFINGVSRVEMTLTDLHARTTDALWQDVDDPTTCIGYSPDHLVQTRFKCVSFMLSVGVNAVASDVTGRVPQQMIHLFRKVSVVVRITRFYHREELEDAWRRHLQLVDVNLGVLKMEYGITDFVDLYDVWSTLCNWFFNGSTSGNDTLSSMDGLRANHENLMQSSPVNAAAQASIELQITFRCTIEAKLKFKSATEGLQELFLVADRAAGNVIFYRHGTRELQISLHELSLRFRGYVVFRLKPDREVFHLEQRFQSVIVKWRVQSIFCRIDNDLAVVLAEMWMLVNEKEQPIVIRCGTCQQQISLDMIDVHVCPPRHCRSLPSTPSADQSARTDSRRNSFSESSSAETSGFETEDPVSRIENATGSSKLHVVLHMDEFELQTGSRMVQNVLHRFGIIIHGEEVDGRDTTTKVSNVRLTTESHEFEGDAIFVPALPLAFQMLECSLQGCGCILRRKRAGDKLTNFQPSNNGMKHEHQWPVRLFLDIAHCSIISQECFLRMENIKVRSSYSDGSRVCSSSQPQLSFHVNMDRIRCQLDELIFQVMRTLFERIGATLSGPNNSSMLLLFLGVLQIRVVEFTLQGGTSVDARAKSLLKQATIVIDNQLGFLCTQSSLDFKTILNSKLMRFIHRRTPAPQTDSVPHIHPQSSTLLVECDTHVQNNDKPQALTVEPPQSSVVPEDNVLDRPHNGGTEATPPNKSEVTKASKNVVVSAGNTELQPLDLEREKACRCIQRLVRRRQRRQQHKQSVEPSEYKSGVMESSSTTWSSSAEKKASSGSPPPRSKNLGVPSTIAVLGPDNDLVSEIRGGFTKLMNPLTLLPTESIRGGFNKFIAPINRTLSPTDTSKRRVSVDSVVPVVDAACYDVTAIPDKETIVAGEEGSSHPKLEEVRPGHPEHKKEIDSNKLPMKQSLDDTQVMVDDEQHIEKLSNPDIAELPKENGLSQAKLEELPEVVRVLVQVSECRMCVPINPREKVDFLCQEIVKRFNETFAADRGSVSAVSLQDKHGGVFSPSDTVGFILAIVPSELLFAYTHEHDSQVRSVARIATGTVRATRSKALHAVGSPRNSIEADDQQKRRYSKLPLPLVIALLANESERDLIRLGICGQNGGEQWPDLALNAASLDAGKNPLLVEIAWHEKCIEVTNGDAFALCRQILGLCTSRVASKYVGKILRARLKVDTSNPLVEWAMRRMLATKSSSYGADAASSFNDEVHPSYEQLKKDVQDTFGVYTR